MAQGYNVLKSGRGTGAPPALGGVAPGQIGKMQASQPAKRKRHELVLSRVLVKEGFVLMEGGSG